MVTPGLSSFAPLPANFAVESSPPSACEQLAAWNDGGLPAKEKAETATTRLLAAPSLPGNARALITAATVALHDPPPASARDSYLTAMNDLIAGARGYLKGKPAAGHSRLASGVTADGKATTLLEGQTGDWDLAASKVTTTLTPPSPRAVRAVAFSPDSTVAVADASGSVYLWCLPNR